MTQSFAIRFALRRVTDGATLFTQRRITATIHVLVCRIYLAK